MTVTEETETKGVAELNDMVETRKEIHLKQGTDITNILGYQSTTVNGINNGETNQMTLGITEDRQKNIYQFDIYHIDVGGEEVLVAFDNRHH